MTKDYYQILGVDKNVDEKTLKKQYRKLSKEYHPDVNPNNPEAEEKFKEVAKAYEVLSDKEKRQNYDMYGSETGSGNPFGGGVNMDDIFNSFFNNGRHSNRGRVKRGSDIRISIKLDMYDVFNGVRKKIRYKRNENCGECNATGGKTKTCTQCGGKGQFTQIVNTPIGRMQNTTQCNSCMGKGEIIIDPCKKCSGRGYNTINEELEFDIPPGISDGESLVLKGKGNSIPKGFSGDLHVLIVELPHEKFKRSFLDIHQRITLSYKELVLGTPKEVETLNGKIRINVKSGTEVGTMLRVSKKGFKREGRVGDMLIEVWVDIPKNISEEEKKIIEGLNN